VDQNYLCIERSSTHQSIEYQRSKYCSKFHFTHKKNQFSDQNLFKKYKSINNFEFDRSRSAAVVASTNQVTPFRPVGVSEYFDWSL